MLPDMPGFAPSTSSKLSVGDAADVDTGAGGVEALGNGAADAAAGTGHHHRL